MLILDSGDGTIKYSKSQQHKINSREDELMKLVENYDVIILNKSPKETLKNCKHELSCIRKPY